MVSTINVIHKLPIQNSLNSFIKLLDTNKKYLIKDYLDHEGNFNFNIVIGMILSFACTPEAKINLETILTNLCGTDNYKNIRFSSDLQKELDDFILKFYNYSYNKLIEGKTDELVMIQDGKFIKYFEAKLFRDHFVLWISFYMVFSSLFAKFVNKTIFLVQQIKAAELEKLMSESDELRIFVERKNFSMEEIRQFLPKFLNLLTTAIQIKLPYVENTVTLH